MTRSRPNKPNPRRFRASTTRSRVIIYHYAPVNGRTRKKPGLLCHDGTGIVVWTGLHSSYQRLCSKTLLGTPGYLALEHAWSEPSCVSSLRSWDYRGSQYAQQSLHSHSGALRFTSDHHYRSLLFRISL